MARNLPPLRRPATHRAARGRRQRLAASGTPLARPREAEANGWDPETAGAAALELGLLPALAPDPPDVFRSQR